MRGATLRVTPFWPKKVALWFRQIEAQFILNKITKDETKFGYVITQLDIQYLKEVEDVVYNPPYLILVLYKLDLSFLLDIVPSVPHSMYTQ